MKRIAIPMLLLLLAVQPAFTQDNFCNPNEQKIEFQGTAPAPWAIDGSVVDWQTILGAYTGDPLFPYHPENAGNNWSLDGYVPREHEDLDSPSVRSDIRFLAHTSDAYNVYLYARRQTNTPGEQTLFYFLDVDVDGYMNNGEPVLKIQYNNKKVTQLTVGEYVVNPNGDLGPTGGNYMTSPGPSYAGFADGYTIEGQMEELFSANRIPPEETLTAGEVFAATVTEDGYGLEIAIPWRYLRNYEGNSGVLQAGDLFAYHIAFQLGGGPYMPQRVVDNAGGCCGGLGVAGNARVTPGNLESLVLQAGSVFHFRFSFTNNTNVEEQVGVKKIILDNFTLLDGADADYSVFKISVYRDDECSGDPQKTGKQAEFEYYNEPSPGVVIYSTLTSIARTVKPGETVCFVADLEIPPSQFKSFSIYFNPDVSISIPFVGCFFPSLIDGGKPINPAAFFMETSVFSAGRSVETHAVEENKVRLYPNPSRGTVYVFIPQGGPRNMDVLDNMGRLVQQWRGVQPGVQSIRSLAKGVYILRLSDDNQKQVITRKFVIN